MLFGLATALAYAVMAFLPPSYAIWMAGIIVATAIFQVVAGAGAGLHLHHRPAAGDGRADERAAQRRGDRRRRSSPTSAAAR